ncbi:MULTISPECIES: hypothetical protein [unclassified Bradyrhizobium]|uniref:hypothetical protein n=1 Tax=unclassified Bradyrhizobium TaxID=2631580 RepID=UPI002916CEB9|nr:MULTISPECIES: hypothetical protein [unclassified Bradyrhizobium]
MADFVFDIREVTRGGFIAWEAVEEGAAHVIDLASPTLIAGTYPEISSHLKTQHNLNIDVVYDAGQGDHLVGQTWTYQRGPNRVIIRDIPRTILRLSGLTA